MTTTDTRLTSGAAAPDAATSPADPQGASERWALFDGLFGLTADPVLVARVPDLSRPTPEIVYSNAAFTGLTGYSPEELLGRSPKLLHGPNTSRSTRQRIREAIANRRPVREEIVNYGRHGAEYWVDLAIAPMALPGTAEHYFLGIQRDITDQRRQALALAESEARFREILSDQSAVVIRFLPDTTFTYVNAAYCALAERSADDLIGKRLGDMLDPEELAQMRVCIDGLTPAVPSRLCARSHRRTSGDVRRLQWTVRALFDGRGALVEYQAVGWDITDLYLANQKHVRSEQLLRDAVESLRDGFVLFDAEDRLVLCNQRMKEIYADSGDLMVPGAKFEDIVRGSLARGTPKDVEEVGTERWIAERLRRHQDCPDRSFEQHLSDGRVVLVTERRTAEGGIVGTRTDITDLKRQEEQLRDSEARLRAHVADLEEAQRKLERQADDLSRLARDLSREKRRAEAANRSQTDFLANMSHELRTPLNAVIGFSEMLEGQYFGPLTARQRDYVKDIHASGTHLLTIINDILDLSKVEAGQIQLASETVDLQQVLEAAITLVRNRAEQGGVTVAALADSDLPVITGDALRLKQVLLNLLSNAVKFTEPGGKVMAGLAREGGTGDILITVRDTGIGMSQEDIALAVQPFKQISTPFSKSQEGTGLGLPIVASLVRLHGGSLDIASQPGEGTTVVVRLPAKRVMRKAVGEVPSDD